MSSRPTFSPVARSMTTSASGLGSPVAPGAAAPVPASLSVTTYASGGSGVLLVLLAGDRVAVLGDLDALAAHRRDGVAVLVVEPAARREQPAADRHRAGVVEVLLADALAVGAVDARVGPVGDVRLL